MQSIAEQDLGTPQRISVKTVTLTIDDREVTVPEGTSVMRAAALADTKIPKLCATDQLEAFGSCRLCLVQIEDEGLPRLHHAGGAGHEGHDANSRLPTFVAA